MPRSTFPYSAADLDRFRQVQRVAYDIALRVESQLQAGITEVEACTLIAAAQAEHEVIQVFHRPYAWFGGRTVPGHEEAVAGATPANAADLAATGVRPSASMFPTDQRLMDGDSVILDLAPVAHGVASDVAYSCAFGHNDVFAELDAGLARIRSTILRRHPRRRVDADAVPRARRAAGQTRLGGLPPPRRRPRPRAPGLPARARTGPPVAAARVGHRRRRADAGGRDRRRWTTARATRCGTTARSPTTPPRRGCGRSSRTSASTASAPSSKSSSS